ncbi:MAG TPA: CotH kinase family protein [Sedimentisphaerales bacterium]|nr:CotH kinase family protein [Sedimentisphaerales bacterium]
MESRGFRGSLPVFLLAGLCLFQGNSCPAGDVPIVINELMASNLSSVADPQGQYDDWIELYNAGDSPVDVGGFYLTDNASEPRKWRIPTNDPAVTTIPAKGFLVIWADGDTIDPGLHASFNLSAQGDEVALFYSDGATRLDRIVFGPQAQNVSYGRHPDGAGEWMLLVLPTPGEANLGVSSGVVADVQFSHSRGFYSNGFTLELTTATEGATIYYSIDGRDPLVPGARGMSGTKYTSPILITRTTVVRAGAVKTGWLSSQTSAHSYIFLDQVIRQPTQPEGFPATWGGRSADYAMDSRVVDDPAYRDEIRDNLKSTPSISIALANSDFFESTGIYANPMMSGPQSERPASVEWIDPSTGESFCINAGIRIHGGPYSRSGNPKNAFRLNFRAEYGRSRLEFPLFPDSDVESFDTLALRSIWNYSWTGDSGMGGARNADYLRDAFARDTVRDMGRLAPHGRPVQVYINGLYWGMYIMTERPTEDFAADYLGGREEDYDILEAPSGSGGSTTMDVVAGGPSGPNAWNALFALAGGNLNSAQAYRDIQAYIDVPTMIDYMLMIYYVGSRDAPVFLGDSRTPRNFYAIRTREPAGPFIIIPWDTEWALEYPTDNRVNVVGVWNPHYLMDRLAANADFRMLLADRIYRHFYNDGVLTRQKTTERYLARADEISGAIVGESARWGDVKRPSQPYTRQDWQVEVNRIVTQYFSGRTETVLGQLRSRGWYPSVEAPVFQINGQDQHGGPTPSQALLGMTKSTPGGTIWYTLDGSDPRVPGVVVVNDDLTLVAENAAKKVLIPTAPVDDAWRGAAEFDDSAWIGGSGGVGYERSTGYEQFFTINVQAAMYGKNGSCLIRIPFDVAAGDLGKITNLVLAARYDDGFVAYLNGSEVARRNATGEPAWNSRAAAAHSDLDAVEFEAIPMIEHMDKLRAGRNILAIHALNDSTTSSDFLISVVLTAGQGAIGTPSGVSMTAKAYAGPVPLEASAQVQARVLSGTTWSALHEAVFAVGPVAQSLRISEIMYHPADTGDPDDPNTEYIELINVGIEMINLNLVRFTKGVDFTFPSVQLVPGAYCLVVKDRSAFEKRYSSGLPVVGQYGGSLSNAGERIELRDAAGMVIHDFRFEDDWYKATDGAGFSLTIVDPTTVDPNALGDPSVWRPSDQPGGSPGSA